MASSLIIIRGNSGSGKSTIAKRLQSELGYGTMLVQQDVLRREILRVKDEPDNPSIQLIYDTVMYGHKLGYSVILEGILTTKNYGAMLKRLIRNFRGKVLAYYFDIPFDETLKRHGTRPNANEFGEAEMRDWWRDKDYLDIKQEKLFDRTQTEEQIIKLILDDLR